MPAHVPAAQHIGLIVFKLVRKRGQGIGFRWKAGEVAAELPPGLIAYVQQVLWQVVFHLAEKRSHWLLPATEEGSRAPARPVKRLFRFL
jgi:hypothetical protein